MTLGEITSIRSSEQVENYEDGRLMWLCLGAVMKNEDSFFITADMHDEFAKLADDTPLKAEYIAVMEASNQRLALSQKLLELKTVFDGRFLNSDEPEVRNAARDHANIVAYLGLSRAQRARGQANRPWEPRENQYPEQLDSSLVS